MQDKLFYQLYKDGKIGYLGKTAKKDSRENRYFPMLEILTAVLDLDVAGFEAKKEELKASLEYLVDQQKSSVVVFSDEIISEIRYRLKKGRDAFANAQRLHYLFSAYEVEILMVLRNQDTIIHSHYVELYKDHEKFFHTDTFEKYLQYGQEHFLDSELLMYDYLKIVELYGKWFGRDKVVLLLYEDLIYKTEYFSKRLSEVLGVFSGDTLKILTDNQSNNKIKSESGTYTQKERVVRRLFQKHFLKAVQQRCFVRYFYELYESNRVFKKLANILILSSLRYKKTLEPVLIKYPNSELKTIIKKLYANNNTILAEQYGLDMQRYNYPLLQNQATQ